MNTTQFLRGSRSFAGRIAICGLFAAIGPVACFGQKKEVVELQRDVAILQDNVRTLQRSLDEKVAALTALLQQTNDNTNKTNISVGVLQSTINEKMNDQAKGVGGTVAAVGAKVDQMSEEFRGVRESIADMNSRMAKLEARIVDLGNAVRTLNAPPAPPPSDASQASPAAPSTAPSGSISAPARIGSQSGPPNGMSAETTYNNAYADLQKGNFDLASQEFSDYLKYYPNTDYAPNAQFYLGDIYYRKADYASAAKAFNQVLSYPDNSKTPSARYLKGMSLLHDGQRNAAAKEFRDLIAKFPDDDVSAKAKAELRKLGLSTSSSRSRRR
ncbi:MAG: outer membrane protein assembly factor BamD [Bryobacteraceae bacterium]